MEGDDSDEEDRKKGKKDKQRKNLFKIERGYIVNKIVKLAMPCYNISDQDSGLNKFKYKCVDSGKAPSKECRSSPTRS